MTAAELDGKKVSKENQVVLVRDIAGFVRSREEFQEPSSRKSSPSSKCRRRILT